MDAVAWRRGRLSLVLLAVTAIVFAACTSSGGTSSSAPAASEAPASEAPASEAPASEAPASEAPAIADPRRPARQGPAGGHDQDVHRPAVPTAVRADCRWRIPGLRHRRRDRDREAARRGDCLRDPELGRPHGRLVGRPLGLQRRLDDDHDAAPGGPRLHRSVLLHAGPDGRPCRQRDHHARRTRRQDDLRRDRHDLPRLAQRHARIRDRDARRRRRPKARSQPPSTRTGCAPRRGRPAAPTSTAGSAQRRRCRTRSTTAYRSSRSATRSSTSRSPLRSTRAVRTRATWSPGSTRSSPRCARTGRSRPCPRSGSGMDLTVEAGLIARTRTDGAPSGAPHPHQRGGFPR